MNEDASINVPLVQGEYHRPSTIRAGAQMLFLDIVGKATPTPLYALRDEVLPKYRSAFAAERARQQPIAEISRIGCSALVDLTYIRQMGSRRKVPATIRRIMKEHAPLYEAGAALLDWADTFSFKGRLPAADDFGGTRNELTFEDHHWPTVVAFYTVLFWQFHQLGPIWERSTPPKWCPPVLWMREPEPVVEPLPPIELLIDVPLPDHQGVRRVTLAGWCTEMELVGQFRKRIGSALDTWIENYIASRRVSAEKAGLERPPAKRKLVRQLTWAAKFQFEKLSAAKLAFASGVATETVDEGIESALKLIHLEKRPPQRGPSGKARSRS